MSEQETWWCTSKLVLNLTCLGWSMVEGDIIIQWMIICDMSSGNTYRFRLIRVHSLFAYRFSIDGHMLKVIASDGHFIEPMYVHYNIIQILWCLR